MKPSVFSQIAILTGVALLAFVAGRFSLETSPLPDTAREVEASSVEKLQTLLDSDYADYRRLKTLEEKYKKADEVLGKIILIFLADLRLRLPSDLPSIESSENPSMPSPAPLNEGKTITDQAKPDPNVRPRQTSISVPLEQLRQTEQVERFLETKKQENFQTAWTRAKPLDAFPQTLNGCYVGTLLEEKKNEVVDLRMFHRLTGNVGQSLMVLTYRDGSRSRSRGKGGPNGYRSDAQDPDAVYIETADSIIYQLYFMPSLNQWMGNAYKKQENESRTYLGRVSLRAGSDCEE